MSLEEYEYKYDNEGGGNYIPEGGEYTSEKAGYATYAYWQFIGEFISKNELEDYFQLYSHKVTATHGKQKSKCNKHNDGHLQTYGYLRCSSVKCIKEPGDLCCFVFKVSFSF